jgi:DHA1 family tetracycline resistance protein-like MFS transporter
MDEPLMAMEAPLVPLHAIDVEEEEVLARERHYSILDRSASASANGDDASGDQSFIQSFFTARGPPQVIFLCMLLALSLGSTVGVTVAVVTDRYARLNHGYTDEADCYSQKIKPEECLLGSADAQNMSAAAGFVSNGLSFVTSSLMGSISDQRGRRGILLLGIFLSLLPPTCLVLLQLFETMSPNFYYVANASTGIVNWIAIALSCLSDVMPKKWRAPSFGLLLAGFSLGFAFSPLLALVFSHLGVSIFSLSLLVAGFLFAACLLPETLPPAIAQEAIRARSIDPEDDCVLRHLMRPLKELSILNRNRLFRLLSALAFFSGMSSSADQSLLVYYLEERLGFNDGDVAVLFMIFGLMGIFVQGVVLKPLNDRIGEKHVVVTAFVFGALHNCFYGLATTKAVIFIGVAIGTLTGMSFPTISAIKSNNVAEHEQGRIQGALYSLSSLASALGPASLRFVYHLTKDNDYPGPGTMFLFAALLYLSASFCACGLPKREADSRSFVDDTYEEREPILENLADENWSNRDDARIDLQESHYGSALSS